MSTSDQSFECSFDDDDGEIEFVYRENRLATPLKVPLAVFLHEDFCDAAAEPASEDSLLLEGSTGGDDEIFFGPTTDREVQKHDFLAAKAALVPLARSMYERFLAEKKSVVERTLAGMVERMQQRQVEAHKEERNRVLSAMAASFVARVRQDQEHRAATKIQCAYRCWQARAELDAARQQRDADVARHADSSAQIVAQHCQASEQFVRQAADNDKEHSHDEDDKTDTKPAAQLALFADSCEQRDVRTAQAEPTLQDRQLVYKQKLELLRQQREKLLQEQAAPAPACGVAPAPAAVKPAAGVAHAAELIEQQKARIAELQELRKKIETERVEFEQRLAQKLEQEKLCDEQQQQRRRQKAAEDETSRRQEETVCGEEQENSFVSAAALQLSPIQLVTPKQERSKAKGHRLTWADDLGLRLDDSTDNMYSPHCDAATPPACIRPQREPASVTSTSSSSITRRPTARSGASTAAKPAAARPTAVRRPIMQSPCRPPTVTTVRSRPVGTPVRPAVRHS